MNNQPPRQTLARLPTPLEPLRRLSKKYKKNIWIKRDDLSETAMSGNKIRKLEYIVAEAQQNDSDVLVTWGALQSNHCRATALVAAKLGLRSHLILRGDPPQEADGNLLIDQIVNSEITYSTPEIYNMMDDSYYELENSYRKKGLKTFRIPVGGSDETGLWGYIKCAEELAIDFSTSGFHPEAMICATGSGGTLGGLIIGNEIHQLDTEVFGVNVCDDRQYFENKIKTDFDLWTRKYKCLEEKPSLPINIIEGYVGQGYGKATPPVFETIREVAQLEGILLDPVYTAKAFHGMISEINNGCLASFQDILFVHTGGIFGIFPQRKGFFNL